MRKARCFCFNIFISIALLFSAESIFAEGNDAYRATLTSTTVSPVNYCGIINTGKHFVYAKSGETIYIGSSALGKGGSVKVTNPAGTTTTYLSSTGQIANRSQEIAGPSPLNSSGYTPISISATEGIWTVEFISSDLTIDLNVTTNVSHTMLANYSWASSDQKNPSGVIVAWDITVANGTTPIPGRVYMNVFTASAGGHDNGFYGKLWVLTFDGFQYTVENNGLAPYVFAFFSNNKGVEDNTTGLPVFHSAANADIVNYPPHTTTTYKFKDPTTSDDAANITNKIFYNTPASDMPTSASIYQGGSASTTWLYNTPVVAVASSLDLTGKEGQTFFSTGALAGGTVKFFTNEACRYKIQIDANNNGVYTDAVDLVLEGDAVAGNNSVIWDGKDGQGNLVTSGTTLNVKVAVFSAEVHFPLSDAENNRYGTILKRLSDADYTIYWNDTSLPGGGTDVSNVGVYSSGGAHIWYNGTGAASGTTVTNNTTTDFGNVNVIDTWAYKVTSPATSSKTVTIKQATDLETVSITKDVTAACSGTATNVNYTVVVKNNGPGDASGAQFIFEVPTGATVNSVSGVVIGTGSTTYLSKGVNSYSNNEWRENINLNNGSTITYTINITVGSGISAGTLTARASMLRAPNITDPDATNPDNGIPTDPVAECSYVNSSITCNNIKTSALAVNVCPADLQLTKTVDKSTPKIGDQVTFTLTAKNNGSGPATNVKVTDALPSGYTFVSSSTVTGSYSNGTGIWTIGSLAVNGTATLTIDATVK